LVDSSNLSGPTKFPKKINGLQRMCCKPFFVLVRRCQTAASASADRHIKAEGARKGGRRSGGGLRSRAVLQGRRIPATRGPTGPAAESIRHAQDRGRAQATQTRKFFETDRRRRRLGEA
jgi:hypothetical protein